MKLGKFVVEVKSKFKKNLQTFDQICSTVLDHILQHGWIYPQNPFFFSSFVTPLTVTALNDK